MLKVRFSGQFKKDFKKEEIHINFYKTGYNHAGKNKDNGNS